MSDFLVNLVGRAAGTPPLARPAVPAPVAPPAVDVAVIEGTGAADREPVTMSHGGAPFPSPPGKVSPDASASAQRPIEMEARRTPDAPASQTRDAAELEVRATARPPKRQVSEAWPANTEAIRPWPAVENLGAHPSPSAGIPSSNPVASSARSTDTPPPARAATAMVESSVALPPVAFLRASRIAEPGPDPTRAPQPSSDRAVPLSGEWHREPEPRGGIAAHVAEGPVRTAASAPREAKPSPPPAPGPPRGSEAAEIQDTPSIEISIGTIELTDRRGEPAGRGVPRVRAQSFDRYLSIRRYADRGRW